MQVFLWKALLGAGVRQDTSFSDMLLFVIINSFMLELTRTNVAGIIENSMIDGTISMELLRPMSYKTYLLTSALGKNTYGTLTRTIPVLIISAFFVKGVSIPDLYSFLLFVVSAFLGILLMFEVTYLAGLLAFWLQRCWFIEFYMMGFERIFGGTMIPIWFYPEFLKKMSFFLPFRYMTFEPINFFLGKTPAREAWLPVLMAHRKENAKHIGVVFGQRSQLYWDLPISDTFELYESLYSIPKAKFQKNCDYFTELFDMKDFINQPVRQLSLGQKLKANIAIALLHDPDVLYLDEPTIGLDVTSKKVLREAPKNINAEKSTTMILKKYATG